MNGVLTQDSG